MRSNGASEQELRGLERAWADINDKGLYACFLDEVRSTAWGERAPASHVTSCVDWGVSLPADEQWKEPQAALLEQVLVGWTREQRSEIVKLSAARSGQSQTPMELALRARQLCTDGNGCIDGVLAHLRAEQDSAVPAPWHGGQWLDALVKLLGPVAPSLLAAPPVVVNAVNNVAEPGQCTGMRGNRCAVPEAAWQIPRVEPGHGPVSSGGQMKPLLPQTVAAGAAIAVGVGTGATAALALPAVMTVGAVSTLYAAKKGYDYLMASTDSSALTVEQRIMEMGQELVELDDGSIATRWDVLNGRFASPRDKREANVDALYPRVTLHDRAQAMEALIAADVDTLKASEQAELARSQDYLLEATAQAWSKHGGWGWLVDLSPSEQRIAVRAIASEDAGLRALQEWAAAGDGAATLAQQAAVVASMGKARFTWGLLKAKAQGVLSGEGQALHGVSTAVKFLNNDPSVQWSTATFTGLGTPIALYNNLLIRDQDGQVVAYRADANTVVASRDEQTFLQTINERRAGQNLAALEGFRADVIDAASPAQQQELRSLYYDDQYVGTPERSPAAWNQQAHVAFDFRACGARASTALDDWASTLAHSRIQRATAQIRLQAEQQRLDNSPTGINARAAALEARVGLSKLQSHQQHALPQVNRMLGGIPKMPNGLQRADGSTAARPSAADIDLTIGDRCGNLTYWATWGWLQPDRVAMGDNWHTASTGRLIFKAWTTDADGHRVEDTAWTNYLNNAAFKEAFYSRMEGLVSSGKLSSYASYLQNFKKSNDFTALSTAMASNVRTRIGALVQTACQSGHLPPDQCIALRSAEVNLDARRSTLLNVQINGSPVEGLFALQGNQEHYIAVLDGPHGDQLMSEAEFKAFLSSDKAKAEVYISQRAGYRYHKNLADAFAQPAAIKLGYPGTEGPVAAAAVYLDKLIDNTHQLDDLAREQANAFMKMVGGLATGLACMTGNVPLCAVGTTVLLVDALQEGVDKAGRGDSDGALEAFGEALETLTDLPGLGAIGGLLFKAGQRAISSVSDAQRLAQKVSRQRKAFNSAGELSGGLKTRVVSRGDDYSVDYDARAAIVHWRGQEYVRTREGGLRATYVDNEGVRRLSYGDEAPIEFTAGAWRRLEERPGALTQIERVREAFPEARWLSNSELRTQLQSWQTTPFAELPEGVLQNIRSAGNQARLDQLKVSRPSMAISHGSNVNRVQEGLETLPDNADTLGNGVYTAEGVEYVRIDGLWYASEIRAPGGFRCLLGDDGRALPDLKLVRREEQWRVVRDESGGLLGGGKFSHRFGARYRDARAKLDTMIADVWAFKDLWDVEKAASSPGAGVQRSLAASAHEDLTRRKEQFALSLQRLLEQSNADQHPHIVHYTEARSAQINTPLRSGRSTPGTQAFLAEFDQLNGYTGVAYRAVHVTPQGAQRLKDGVGQCFRDSGVQSASTQFINALDWKERWAAGAAPEAASNKVVFIYDETVRKKNLAGTLLTDHVAVVPGAVTKVMAVKEVGDILYVSMSSPKKLPDHVFEPYTGAEVMG